MPTSKWCCVVVFAYGSIVLFVIVCNVTVATSYRAQPAPRLVVLNSSSSAFGTAGTFHRLGPVVLKRVMFPPVPPAPWLAARRIGGPLAQVPKEIAAWRADGAEEPIIGGIELAELVDGVRLQRPLGSDNGRAHTCRAERDGEGRIALDAEVASILGIGRGESAGVLLGARHCGT